MFTLQGEKKIGRGKKEKGRGGNNKRREKGRVGGVSEGCGGDRWDKRRQGEMGWEMGVSKQRMTQVVPDRGEGLEKELVLF